MLHRLVLPLVLVLAQGGGPPPETGNDGTLPPPEEAVETTPVLAYGFAVLALSLVFGGVMLVLSKRYQRTRRRLP